MALYICLQWSLHSFVNYFNLFIKHFMSIIIRYFFPLYRISRIVWIYSQYICWFFLPWAETKMKLTVFCFCFSNCGVVFSHNTNATGQFWSRCEIMLNDLRSWHILSDRWMFDIFKWTNKYSLDVHVTVGKWCLGLVSPLKWKCHLGEISPMVAVKIVNISLWLSLQISL